MILTAMMGVMGASPLAASAAPNPAETSAAAGIPSGTVTSPTVTVTVSGGVAPYAHAWSKLSGDTMAVSNPNGASTLFSATVLGGNSKSAIYQDTVTDNIGNVVVVSATITLNNTSI
jgi:hypothetical protein